MFQNVNDPDYQKILVHIEAAQKKLAEIRRFDMPGFRPTPTYVREMQRYGILPRELAVDAPVDVYAAERAYWRSLWWRPTVSPGSSR